MQILLVAAEASSVLYAERLIQEAQRENSGVSFFGVGNQSMENLGFRRIGKSEEMAVVGIFEVLKHYRRLRNIFYQLLEEVDRLQPKIAVLMDYPGFNIRLAKELKKRGIRVIYYIAPQIWAWKKDRVYQIKENCDLVLSLFPFETKFYEEFGVPVQFVGHPLVDELEPDWLDSKNQLIRRHQSGIGDNEFVLGFMPGSRESELRYQFPGHAGVSTGNGTMFESTIGGAFDWAADKKGCPQLSGNASESNCGYCAKLKGQEPWQRNLHYKNGVGKNQGWKTSGVKNIRQFRLIIYPAPANVSRPPLGCCTFSGGKKNLSSKLFCQQVHIKKSATGKIVANDWSETMWDKLKNTPQSCPTK
jgi:hypothetical protein